MARAARARRTFPLVAARARREGAARRAARRSSLLRGTLLRRWASRAAPAWPMARRDAAPPAAAASRPPTTPHRLHPRAGLCRLKKERRAWPRSDRLGRAAPRGMDGAVVARARGLSSIVASYRWIAARHGGLRMAVRAAAAWMSTGRRRPRQPSARADSAARAAGAEKNATWARRPLRRRAASSAVPAGGNRASRRTAGRPRAMAATPAGEGQFLPPPSPRRRGSPLHNRIAPSAMACEKALRRAAPAGDAALAARRTDARVVCGARARALHGARPPGIVAFSATARGLRTAKTDGLRLRGEAVERFRGRNWKPVAERWERNDPTRIAISGGRGFCARGLVKGPWTAQEDGSSSNASAGLTKWADSLTASPAASASSAAIVGSTTSTRRSRRAAGPTRKRAILAARACALRRRVAHRTVPLPHRAEHASRTAGRPPRSAICSDWPCGGGRARRPRDTRSRPPPVERGCGAAPIRPSSRGGDDGAGGCDERGRAARPPRGAGGGPRAANRARFARSRRRHAAARPGACCPPCLRRLRARLRGPPTRSARAGGRRFCAERGLRYGGRRAVLERRPPPQRRRRPPRADARRSRRDAARAR